MKAVTIIAALLLCGCLANENPIIENCQDEYNLSNEKAEEIVVVAIQTGEFTDMKGAQYFGCLLGIYGMLDGNTAKSDRISDLLESQNINVPKGFHDCIDELRGDHAELAKGVAKCIQG